MSAGTSRAARSPAMPAPITRTSANRCVARRASNDTRWRWNGMEWSRPGGEGVAFSVGGGNAAGRARDAPRGEEGGRRLLLVLPLAELGGLLGELPLGVGVAGGGGPGAGPADRRSE